MGLPRSQRINEQKFHFFFSKIITVGVGDPSLRTVGAAQPAWRSLPSASSLLAALHAWMDTEGLLHGAINILFMNVSGFSRQTMHYFMVGKNQRKFK